MESCIVKLVVDPGNGKIVSPPEDYLQTSEEIANSQQSSSAQQVLNQSTQIAWQVQAVMIRASAPRICALRHKGRGHSSARGGSRHVSEAWKI